MYDGRPALAGRQRGARASDENGRQLSASRHDGWCGRASFSRREGEVVRRKPRRAAVPCNLPIAQLVSHSTSRMCARVTSASVQRQPQADSTLDSQAILDVIDTVREEIEPGVRYRRGEL
jgi:hypothetical protein